MIPDPGNNIPELISIKKKEYSLSSDETLESSAASNIIPNETKTKYLSEAALFLYIQPTDKPFPPVPPPSPRELISDCYVTVLPELPDSLQDIEIPYIRECGIRDAIGILAKHFKCEDYRNNLVHFWFLDVLVDCIWRAQDEFSFSIQEQKLVLEWILFVIKVIISDNMTKSLMFKIFNDALLIAEEYVQSGGLNPPTPKSLFTLKLNEGSEDQNKDAISLISGDSLAINPPEDVKLKPSKQYIIVKQNTDVQVFEVPNNEVLLDECLSSSIEPPSENEFEAEEFIENAKAEEVFESDSFLRLLKPEMSTPPRFKSLRELNVLHEEHENSVSSEHRVEEENSHTIREWFNIPRKVPPPCPKEMVTKKTEATSQKKTETSGQISQITESGTSGSYTKTKQDSILENQTRKSVKNVKEEILDNEQVFKIYYDYNMWQLKNEYMADPKMGWTPSLTSYKSILEQKKLKNITENKDANISSTKGKTELAEREKKVFINMCVLMAVKQIVFEYFDYNFSFELVRISLKDPQYLITQDINTNWNIPKQIKGEINKPMPKEPKKEKPKKEKPTKEKKDASSKKTKGTKEKGKKEKDKKSKSDKKSSKKSDKVKQLTKEEKKEMERLKKEQEEIDRQRFKEEENKRFMFPLKDAVDDSFFTEIFPDFKTHKGGKKGDKDSKSSKSDKSSKSGKKKK